MTSSKNEVLPRYFYAGSYTAPYVAPGASSPALGQGISIFKLSNVGTLEFVDEVETPNPSSLAISPDNSVLYSVNELGLDDDGMPLGSVTAFTINPETGGLSVLNKQSTRGGWPCHCSVHPSGRYLMAANYGTGEFLVFAIEPDGRIGKATFVARSDGCGPETARQSGPHAHMILTDPQALRVYGVDLGTDRVLSWSLDDATGHLTASAFPSVQIANGCGPRHMAFSSDGRSAFVLNELSSTVDVFDVNTDTGSFIWRQTASLLPAESALKRPTFDPSNPGFIPAGTNTGAEIRLHPTGKWLYATNRGMNTVVQFHVDVDSRTLMASNWTESQGDCPRGMIIDPQGQFLIVGNQNTNNIAVFSIDQHSGALGDPIQALSAGTLVDFVFGPEA